jgi:hypothetical protein
MRNPTPVIIRSMRDDSGSIRKLIDALKLPALIQLKSVTWILRSPAVIPVR